LKSIWEAEAAKLPSMALVKWPSLPAKVGPAAVQP
jgi:hypothetical protein